jgi:hypothetical protein
MRTWVGACLLAAAALGAGVACGGDDPAAPDTLTRGTEGPGPVDPIVAGAPDAGYPTEPPVEVDGGCCPVGFALTQEQGEVAARLVFPGRTYPMGEADGGGWYVDACVDLVQSDFYFQTALPAEGDADAGTDDGGTMADVDGGAIADPDAGAGYSGDVLWVDRVNEAVETSDSSSLAPRVNVFAVPEGEACDTFDGSAYAQLPDAG